MVSNLTVKVGADIAGLQRELSKASAELGMFGKGMSAISSQIQTAFAGIGIAAAANFTLEVSKLAGEAEGVKAAFDKLPGSIKLMDDLKRATGGTVSELDLMKRAVMASNFGISLKALPKLLEFATVRAKQTGQSVDYLVDSIVTGIGRKSKLILDNLGISAVQLTEALGGASTAASSIEQVADAVGGIAARELERMGSLTDNASTKLDKLSASFINLKVWLGDVANSTGILGTAVDHLGKTMDVTANESIPLWAKWLNVVTLGAASAELKQYSLLQTQIKVRAESKKQAQITREVDKAFIEFKGNIDAYSKAIQTHIYRTELLDAFTKKLTATEQKRGDGIETIASLEEKLKTVEEDRKLLAGSNLIQANQEIKLIEEKIKKLKELGTVQAMTKPNHGLNLSNEIGSQTFVGNNKFKGLYEKTLEGTPDSSKYLKEAMELMSKQDKALQKSREKLREFGDEWVKVWANVGIAAMNVKPILDDLFINLSVGFGDALGNIASGLGGTEQIFSALLGAVGNMATQLGQLAIATGIAVAGIKKALMTLNPAVAIAGGIALVALGKLVSNKAASIANSGSGGGVSGGGGSGLRSDRSASRIGISDKKYVAVMPSGEWKISGRDLKYIVDKENNLDGKRKKG